MSFPNLRLRRLRSSKQLRNLLQETEINLNDLVLPLFIRHGQKSIPISSMPGHTQICLADLPSELEKLSRLGIHTVLLFGIPEEKNPLGKDSYSEQGIIQQAIKIIKKYHPEILVITDVCLCEYTDHGHCGFIDTARTTLDVENDITLNLLAQQALSHVMAGADIVAPSSSMDGMVGAIRRLLDQNNFCHIPILSYSVKYASALYSPFRQAAEGAPSFGDRKSYQMNPANGNEAIREAQLDLAEGADILMVKPAGWYLDILYRLKQHFPEVPCAAYQVSGEFSLIKAAAAQGWIDEQNVAMESLLAIKRAGADFIISYFAAEVAKWLSA